MATPAQIAANQRNSQLSCGPVTERGKQASSQNARKHGLRAVREEVLRGEALRYEERKGKWMSELEPRTDREEYLAHQQVLTSLMVDRVHAAYVAKVTTDIEEADEREGDIIEELGERLYFNRAGLAATHGCLPHGRNKQLTSSSGKSVDPDSPRKLVKEIAKSARGCRWLLREWMKLKERLEGTKCWQTVDRFRAIRLLGKQPVDAGTNRVIAEIFAASNALEAVRTKDSYDSDLAGIATFRDLLSDMTSVELEKFAAKFKVAWPDLLKLKDPVRCREILVELVDRELVRLSGELTKHLRNVQKHGEKSVARLSFDLSQDGELLRRYDLRYKSSLYRSIEIYDKVSKRERRGGYEEVTRRPEPIPSYGRRGGAELDADLGSGRSEGRGCGPGDDTAREGGRWREEGGGRSDGGCGPDDDTQWALEIDGADVLACGGLLPKRVKVEGGERRAEGGGGSGEGEASGGATFDAWVMADRAGDGEVGNGDLGADVVESGAEGRGAAGGAVTSGLAADGTGNVPGSQEMDGTRGAGDAPIDGSDDEACIGARASGEDGELDRYGSGVTDEPKMDEDAFGLQVALNQEVVADSDSASGLDKNGNGVTNEPKTDEHAVGVQETLNQEVMADSGSDSGLDTGENEAISEPQVAGVAGAGSRGDEGLIGGRTNRASGSAGGGAGSKKQARKSKRKERKELTKRELERRLRAAIEEPGSVAEARKLIGGVRDVWRVQFRMLMPDFAWTRGP